MRRRRGPAGRAALTAAILYGALLAACGPDGRVHLDVNADPPEQLSAYNFFTWDAEAGAITYHDDLIAYDLNTALFSDYALKSRAIYVPEDTSIEFRDHGVFEFPEGAAVVKSFLFPEDLRAPSDDVTLIETRVLRKTPDGWEGLPYVWNDEGTDAELDTGGRVKTVSFIDPDGEARTANYLIPQKNQCNSCHELLDDQDERYTTLIGTTARNLHRDNPAGSAEQLTEWADRGVLEGLPDVEAVTPAFDFATFAPDDLPTMDAPTITSAARDYLDVNCAHCHNARATQGITSQLFLNWDNDDAFNYGVCKRPGSAGAGAQVGEFDIEPGSPDTSILVFRLETEEVGAMMPLLGRSLAHHDGAALVRAWVASLEGVCE